MEIEKLVLSIEQAMNLQKLGLDMSDAALCYLIFTDSNGQRYSRPWFYKELCDTDEFVPTYTLQEILDKIPEVQYSFGGKPLKIRYGNANIDADYCIKHELLYYNITDHKTTNLEGAYKLMEWVLKNLNSGFFNKVNKEETK